MPNFIAGLILPFITSSPIFFEGPLIAGLVTGAPKGATDRAAFLDQITACQPGDLASAKQIKFRGMMLLRATRLLDGVPDDQIEVEPVPPDMVPFDRIGRCLEPLVQPDAELWPDLDAATVSPGDIVVTTWRGSPWMMAKIFLGHVPSADGPAALFYQSNPPALFEVPLSLITHAVRVWHETIYDALPEDVHAIMAGLDDRPIALPNAGSVNNGLTMVVTELFHALRSLPEASAEVAA
jgi:hypothetical protein